MQTLKIALCGLVLAGAAHADTIKLTYIPTGAMPKMGGYRPQRLTLSTQKPPSIKRFPLGLAKPLFGVLNMGAADKPTPVALIVDEPAGKESRLYVDANANGDLTDDPRPEWKPTPYKGQDGADLTRSMGGASITIRYGKQPVTLHLGLYRFDPKDTMRAALKDLILYYTDYAYEGNLALNGKNLRAMLVDSSGTGDYRGKAGEKSPSVYLYLDVNGNGKFDGRGEVYDVTKPFNIGGTTFEIANMQPSGATFEIVKSKQVVEEILPPPTFNVGGKALVFEAKTTEGNAISLASSYKGKIVMLDFWATWCGPCRGEIPHLTKAFEKYNSRGFEVLGISLDQEKAETKLADFTKENKMPWPQVYDGKYWQAEIAQKYGIESIPAAFLIDGDTGVILAMGGSLRGEELDATIAKALEKKGL